MSGFEKIPLAELLKTKFTERGEFRVRTCESISLSSLTIMRPVLSSAIFTRSLSSFNLTFFTQYSRARCCERIL